MHIGNRIKEEVNKRGMSVTNFAKLIKKSRPYTYSIFDKENIDTELLIQIASALGVSPVIFFEEITPNVMQNGTENILVGRDNNGNITTAGCEAKLQEALQEIKHLQEIVNAKNQIIEVMTSLQSKRIEPLIDIYAVDGPQKIDIRQISNIVPCTGKEPEFEGRINSGTGHEYPCCIVSLGSKSIYVMQDSVYIWSLITNKLSLIIS